MIKGSEYGVVNQVPMSVRKGLEDSNLYLVHTPEEWKAFFEVLMSKKLVACDTETTGFRWYQNDRIVGMSFGWGKDNFYAPVRHSDSYIGGKQPEQLDMDVIRKDLQTFFSQQDIFTIWHNAKFDMHFYNADDIKVLTPFHDTSFSWHLLDENAPNALKAISSGWTDTMKQRHKGLYGPEAAVKEKEVSAWRKAEAKGRRDHLKRMIMSRADELKTDMMHQDKNRTQLKKWIAQNELHDHEYVHSKKDDIHYGYIPVFPLMTEYAAMDTFLTWGVHHHVMSTLNMTSDLANVYINEVKLCKSLFEQEEGGALVDPKVLQDLATELTREIEEARVKVHQVLGSFNIASNDQLVERLQNHGVVLTKKTKTGYSVDKDVLEKLRKKYPIVEDIQYLRESEKLLNTYALGIQDKMDENSLLHMNFNQNVTTGRMSCREPNLQNIPRSDTRIRRAFVCPEDYYFVFADYSQVEVRLTAHFSEDPVMLDAYAKDQDIHSRSACEMFAISYDEFLAVTSDDTHEFYKKYKELRTVAKRINFGIIYGVGAPGLSTQIPRPDRYKDAPESEWVQACQDYINLYFRKYRGVKRFVNRCKRTASKYAEIPNHFGRVRHLPHVNAVKILGDEGKWMRGRAMRQSPNFVIQSTAADVFKFATVRVYEEVLKDTQSRIVNLVHDEIQSYIHKDELHLLNKKREVMEDFDFKVPLKVDFAYSTTSWADKKGLG